MINGIAQVSSSAELSKNLQNARLSLAQYRSALVVGTITYTAKITGTPPGNHLIMHRGSKISGGYIDIQNVKDDFILFDSSSTAKLTDNVNIIGTVFSGGHQTLDGFHWINATFVGTHIRYRGGELDLDHVTFIGCTF